MNYEKFRQTFSKSEYIRLADILLHYPNIDRKQLSRWSEVWLLLHPARGLYVLPERQIDREWMMIFSHGLVNPSYISLEYALSYYGLIPEEAVVITAITTKKTQSYDLGWFGRYRYQSIVERWFVGYSIRGLKGRATYDIATPAKAIVDFLYLHGSYMTSEDFEEWRINTYEVPEQVTPEELRNLASYFRNKRLTMQVESFISFIW